MSGQIRVDQGRNQFVIFDIDTNQSIVFGATPDGFGSAYYDGDGDLIKTENGKRELRYDNDEIPYYISGELPDGTRGDVYAKEGIDVRDVFN